MQNFGVLQLQHFYSKITFATASHEQAQIQHSAEKYHFSLGTEFMRPFIFNPLF